MSGLLFGGSRPLLLDLFCGAGGCGKGYHDAGFDVIGVDLKPQPRYPFEFIQAEAVEFLQDLLQTPGLAPAGERAQWWLAHFAAIHASPPCPRYSAGSTNWNGRPDDHPDLVEPVRELVEQTGLPYVIENVPGAPLRNAITLCGSSFGLRVRRHRLFETNWPLMSLPCAHYWQTSNPHRLRASYVPPANSVVPVYGGGQAGFPVALCREAMGIDWMTTDELNDAIPPAFTEFIGEQLMQHIALEAAA